jgi:hypothetical protein
MRGSVRIRRTRIMVTIMMRMIRMAGTAALLSAHHPRKRRAAEAATAGLVWKLGKGRQGC